MTSSRQTPRIRRTAYEPATAQPQPSVVACPHCGATLAVGAAAAAVEEADGARAAVAAGLPDAGALRVPVARVLRLVLEVIDGRRPARQLEGVVAPSVLRYARAARLAGRPVRVSRLRSLRMCRPTEHALEAAAVVVSGPGRSRPGSSTSRPGGAVSQCASCDRRRRRRGRGGDRAGACG
jgi:hypothetical protein